jgi:hypothetical protein
LPLLLWTAWDHSVWLRARQVLALVWLLFVWPLWAQSLWWGKRSVRALVWNLFLRPACAQSLCWRPDRQGPWSGLVSIPLIGVGSASHCVGRHDR